MVLSEKKCGVAYKELGIKGFEFKARPPPLSQRSKSLDKPFTFGQMSDLHCEEEGQDSHSGICRDGHCQDVLWSQRLIVRVS